MGVNSVRKIGSTFSMVSSLQIFPSSADSVFFAREGIAATPP